MNEIMKKSWSKHEKALNSCQYFCTKHRGLVNKQTVTEIS